MHFFALMKQNSLPTNRFAIFLLFILFCGLFTHSQSAVALNCEQSITSEPVADEIPKERLNEIIQSEIKAGKIKVQKDKDGVSILEILGKNLHPELLHQLGVLREITFREVGEGTGKALDTDESDLRYDHIIVWNGNEKEIQGAYRVLDTTDSVQRGALDELYSNKLMNYGPGFFENLGGNALELGRSFVVKKYQGAQSQTLAQLWSGIGLYLLDRPHIKKMMGLASMSGRFSKEFQSAVTQYMLKNHSVENPDLKNYLDPTLPFFPEELQNPQLAELILEPLKVNQFGKRLEALTGEKLPSLYNFYVSLVGVKFITFNFDPSFNTMDGFILVDIRDISLRMAKSFVGDRAEELLNR